MRPKPQVVLDLDVSAYHARIDFDGETLVLATPRGLELAPRGGTRRTIAHDFGETFALRGTTVVYFRGGQLLKSLHGAPPTVLGSFAQAPGLIVHDGKQIAWLSGGPKGTTLFTLRGGKPHSIAELEGRVDTMALGGGWLYFFEQRRSGGWRLGAVALAGGEPRHRDWQTGRVPSTLAVATDLFYYDGPSRSVRRVSPDLEAEEVLASGVICSPLAAQDRVTCAHVGGLYELPRVGGAPEKLAEQAAFVTALATSAAEVAWVSDSGRDRLRVQRLALGPAP